MIQSVVGWGDRGAVTALNQFSRTIGGAVGVALMGILLESRIHDAALRRGLDPQRYSDPLQYALHPAAQTAAGRDLVINGMVALKWVYVVLALMSLLISLRIVMRGRVARLEPREEALIQPG
jgi:hypothetical protein